MVQIWRPGDNFCAFKTLSKMANLKFCFALMKKRQSFCYPTVQRKGKKRKKKEKIVNSIDNNHNI
jgi:hypothetical protein